MPSRVGPSCARVDLDALAANVATLRLVAGRAQVLTVVKADGYGHGMVQAARAALAGGATWLGVAQLGEALTLRGAGVSARLLAWLFTPGEDLVAPIRADIDLGVSSLSALSEVAAAARAAGRTARVHLKLDTGMHRAGCPVDRWVELVARAARAERLGAIRVVGVWSHLSHASSPADPHNRRQVEAFQAGLALAEAAGLRPEVRHLCGTAGAVGVPEARLDLVRIGAGLVGIDEVGAGLRPALTLRTRVLQVRRVVAGDGVGYDHAGRVGYADGIPRCARSAWVSWHGHRLPLLGRVSMDQVVVDAGDLPVRPGDEVVVLGRSAGAPRVEDWARWAETIPHEIYTGLGPRVVRAHTGTGGAQ